MGDGDGLRHQVDQPDSVPDCFLVPVGHRLSQTEILGRAATEGVCSFTALSHLSGVAGCRGQALARCGGPGDVVMAET